MSAENVRVVQSIYEAALQGNLESVAHFFDADFALYEADSLPYGGVYQGAEGLMQALIKIRQTLGDFKIEVAGLLDAGDEYVIAMLDVQRQGGQTGKAFDMAIAEFWKMKEQRVVELRPFYWDTAKFIESLR